MKPALTDTLCARCGLCCDGSLFADVELAGRAEASAVEAMGLEVEDTDAGGGLLVQPCAALKGKRCGIYPHRPECCRTFECRLLQDARRSALTVEQAVKHVTEAVKRIGRVRQLAAELGQRDASLPLRERCAEALALAAESAPYPTIKRSAAQLEAEMALVESLIRRKFLHRATG